MPTLKESPKDIGTTIALALAALGLTVVTVILTLT